MGDLQIYLDPCTINCRKVLAGLDLMGTKYDLHHIDYFGGQHKSDEYLKINPSATVPAATVNGAAITESNAILQYAGDLDGGHAAYPKDLVQRANVNRWLLWEASVWFPSCYTYAVQNVVTPIMKGKPDQGILSKEEPNFQKLAKLLDMQLAKTKYLCGDEPTIADIAVASPMQLEPILGLPLSDYPNLKRWYNETIQSLPAWQKTEEPVDKLRKMVPGTVNGTNGVSTNGASKEVRTKVNYTKDLDQPTEIYFYDSEKAQGTREPGDDPQEISVHDGWSRAKDFNVDKQGFSIHDFHSDFNTWEDDDATATKFYPEVVDFLKQSLGAKRVLVFDHTIRTKANVAKKLQDEKQTSQRAPVMLVHCDYTAESGPTRVRQLLNDEADDLLSRRVAFINVWKPIRRVVEERPLAMCDVTSCTDEDFFKLHLRYRDRNGENYVMRHSNRHKWYYFPKITPEQVILLKTYESESDGRARFVGHTAFEDPTSPPDAPTRESVEIRTICFF